ncbi:hypothetical protein [Streptomyces sp. NRRL S-337]|uniref:hypothetical protein n=1 Tax=Streptomyces sp. NRRL S-337 TaxID=1463900 RepID=UPI000B1DC43D|nr:hypothetical protein [Streptomyces sp. NRRL S-337]
MTLWWLLAAMFSALALTRCAGCEPSARLRRRYRLALYLTLAAAYAVALLH